MSTPEQPTSNEFQRSDFQYVEMAYQEPNYFHRNLFGDVSMIPTIRQQQQNTGLYRSAYFYNTLDPYEALYFGDFYLDFDSEDDIEKAREDLLYVIWKMNLHIGYNLPMEAFHVYFSGKKGFHLLIPWQYMNIQPSKKLPDYFKWMASELKDESPYGTIDLVIYQPRGLYRLENSIHQDTGLYKIPLQYKEAAYASIEEIQASAQTNRTLQHPLPHISPKASEQYQKMITEYEDFLSNRHKFIHKAKPIPEGETPDAVQELIDRGPVQGLRNETTAALTSYWKNQGYEEDDILALLLEWNQGSQPEKDVRTTMKSILKRDLNYGINRFKALTEGEIVSYAEEREQYKQYRKGKRR